MTLLEKVESLPQKTPAEGQKKAVLRWLLEDSDGVTGSLPAILLHGS